ncbi:hypothetical protein Pmar_PMAR028555 [Perkinsus marinus ATCC 50983]|uniref:Uncharacterized protein n=1 Tax=Perkinsus marinus (strain ATCC 50983 / TXsc) TaxID=423536 RepID=C5K5G1_PERM5|nr:hypothetical protein Pmar_PMAR028555 [Perkinsus marinus ATCC 50983]EER20277.1 hypothetical protein Pmar_PMAR028555 [Perkinsus marinus ATCC 50983]|eukprot:XP_002788481.1 hypothetical protein Pmar_PMAR028555 [Perkinsus marinus ATCC 50983]
MCLEFAVDSQFKFKVEAEAHPMDIGDIIMKVCMTRGPCNGSGGQGLHRSQRPSIAQLPLGRIGGTSRGGRKKRGSQYGHLAKLISSKGF